METGFWILMGSLWVVVLGPLAVVWLVWKRKKIQALLLLPVIGFAFLVLVGLM